jgi:dephospho-CoA kinase
MAAGTRDWQSRFDKRVLVTAPEALRIARYVARIAGANTEVAMRGALEDEARQRMAAQMPDEEKMRRSDIVIRNDSSLEELARQTETVYRELHTLIAASRRNDRNEEERTTRL